MAERPIKWLPPTRLSLAIAACVLVGLGVWAIMAHFGYGAYAWMVSVWFGIPFGLWAAGDDARDGGRC